MIAETVFNSANMRKGQLSFFASMYLFFFPTLNTYVSAGSVQGLTDDSGTHSTHSHPSNTTGSTNGIDQNNPVMWFTAGVYRLVGGFSPENRTLGDVLG